MIDQNPNPNINTIPQTPVPTLREKILSKTKLVLSRLLVVIKESKFYSNKKIFWPVIVAVGLVFLVILLGLIFGKRNGTRVALQTPTPTPIIQNTPQASDSGNILTQSQSKLNNLKKEINSLDVRQSRLQPPSLDFDIEF